MAFTIDFYKNLSPANMLAKELEHVAQATGVLRKGASITDPVIEVETSNNAIWPASVNYCHIPALNRYYYITNLITEHMMLWTFHGHVDVLMSFKEQIRAQEAVVSRQEGKYNLYLDDGFFMTYQNPKIQTKLFSVADPFETQEFVLVVAGS